jgi:hypothetical protein
VRRLKKICSILLLISLFKVAGAASQPESALYIKAFGVKRVGDCRRQIAMLSAELQSLHFPKGWTIAVACTAVAWTESLRLAGYPPSDSAFTSLHAQITVLNGAVFSRLQSEYRRTIAHELGHIACHCTNEVRADAMALRLERQETAADVSINHEESPLAEK